MYQVSAGVRSTQNEDGAVVLHIARGQVFRLNTTGAVIFEKLQTRHTESQINQAISEEFRIPLDLAATHVREFLESLEKQGLVRRENEQDSRCP